MNQKMNSNFFSRKAHPLLSGESRASQTKHQEYIGGIFLSLRKLYIRNLFLHTLWLMSITTERCCCVWGSRSSKHIWNEGRTKICWFTMTVHWSSLFCQCKVLSTKNIHGVSHPPYLPDLAPCDSSCFQEWSCSYEGVTVGCPWNLGTVADFHIWNSKRTVPAVAEMLDLLHKHRRVLLCRGHQWPVTKVSIF